MDAASVSASTRAAINGAEGNQAITALKMAAQADKAIVAVIEEVAETAKALAPAGQGRNVDRLA